MTTIYRTEKSICARDSENIMLLTKFDNRKYYVMTIKPNEHEEKGLSIRLSPGELRKLAEQIYLEAFTNELYVKNDV